MKNLKQLTQNLYEIRGGVNTHILITGDRELALVDAGFPGMTRAILAAISAIGYQAGDVKYILVTHADFDHVGSLKQLVDATGAAVYAGDPSVRYIESASSPPHVAPAIAWFSRIVQRWLQKKVRVDYPLTDGQRLDIGGGIIALHAPGHTEENFCYFWEREHALFSADLLNRMNGVLRLTPPAITWEQAAARASAARVLALNPQIICFGHGAALKAADSQPELEALKKTL